jgi:hypothetical protein
LPTATRNPLQQSDGYLGGLPVSDNRGRSVIQPAGRGARIVWESSFAALDPTAEAKTSRRWAGMLPVVLGNLKTLIEQQCLTSPQAADRRRSSGPCRSLGQAEPVDSKASWKPVMAWIPPSATTSTIRP